VENEATNLMQEKLVKNRHLADQLRHKLMQPRGRAKMGYGPEDTFVHILNDLTNEPLVSKYLAHSVIQRLPMELI
jgi:hypothetical protein